MGYVMVGFLVGIFTVYTLNWLNGKKKVNLQDEVKRGFSRDNRMWVKEGIGYIDTIVKDPAFKHAVSDVEVEIFTPRHILEWIENHIFHNLIDQIKTELFKIDSDVNSNLKIEKLPLFVNDKIKSHEDNYESDFIIEKTKLNVKYIQEQKNQFIFFFLSCIYDNYPFTEQVDAKFKAQEYFMEYLILKCSEIRSNDDFLVKNLTRLQTVMYTKRVLVNTFLKSIQPHLPDRWTVN
jgi:hypothetical protein